MEEDISFLFTPEDIIYWCFPWTLPIRTIYHRYPTTSIHPLFGASYGTIYYLPVIAEQDELEPELSTERIQIEELPKSDNDSDDNEDGVTKEKQQQRYIVEEPPEEDEEMKAEERKLPQSWAKRGDICEVVLESHHSKNKPDA